MKKKKNFNTSLRKLAKDLHKRSSKDLLTQEEAAKYLALSQTSLVVWRKQGIVPFLKLPNSTEVLYSKIALNNIINKKES